MTAFHRARVSCLLAIASALAVPLISIAQEKPINYYEVIKNDSIVLFFNSRYHYVEKGGCVLASRNIRRTRRGFEGYFEDRLAANNALLAKGAYAGGKRNGDFEIYYPNGKLKAKGNYAGGKPTGIWEFFYENGSPERTLNLTSTDTLIVGFADKKGKVTVTDGNGIFSGPIASGSGPGVVTKGNVKNGRPDGNWTSTQGKSEYCVELFEQGKMTRGKFANLKGNGYTSRSYLDRFFLPTYLDEMELFFVEQCTETEKSSTKVNLSYDIQKFDADLRYRIRDLVESDMTQGKSGNYPLGDTYVSIEFTVNADGRGDRFSLSQGTWAAHFVNPIGSSIRSNIKFPPSSEKMYFHLKFHFDGGATYGFSYMFSRNMRSEL